MVCIYNDVLYLNKVCFQYENKKQEVYVVDNCQVHMKVFFLKNGYFWVGENDLPCFGITFKDKITDCILYNKIILSL